MTVGVTLKTFSANISVSSDPIDLLLQYLLRFWWIGKVS